MLPKMGLLYSKPILHGTDCLVKCFRNPKTVSFKLRYLSKDGAKPGIRLLTIIINIACNTNKSRYHKTLRERSGSVVECLTRDQEAAGSSLTGVTVL